MNTPKIKMLVLSLTGQCNFACKYCYAAEHDGSMLKVDDAIKAVDLAAVSGEKFVIQFSGGEMTGCAWLKPEMEQQVQFYMA